MNIMDKLFNELEMVEYTLDQYEEEEVALSEKEYGFLLGKKSILNDLIMSIENGEIVG